jgi:hypothetical protein
MKAEVVLKDMRTRDNGAKVWIVKNIHIHVQK